MSLAALEMEGNLLGSMYMTSGARTSAAMILPWLYWLDLFSIAIFISNSLCWADVEDGYIIKSKNMNCSLKYKGLNSHDTGLRVKNWCSHNKNGTIKQNK